MRDETLCMLRKYVIRCQYAKQLCIDQNSYCFRISYIFGTYDRRNSRPALQGTLL